MPQINLILAWLWLCLGFVSGAIMGLFFHKEQWLGGYASLKRRLYRLAHISFFGLGLMNLAFFLTIQALQLPANTVGVAGWFFIVGAISMPLCCLLMAQFPRVVPLFSLPVLSLLAGGLMTVSFVVQATPIPQSRGLRQPPSLTQSSQPTNSLSLIKSQTE